MESILKWVIIGFVIFGASYLFPGIQTTSFWAAFFTAVVLSLINILVRPIIVVLTLPINFITLGLFTFVINALMVMLAGILVPGFIVTGFWWALVLSVIISAVRTFLD